MPGSNGAGESGDWRESLLAQFRQCANELVSNVTTYDTYGEDGVQEITVFMLHDPETVKVIETALNEHGKEIQDVG